MKEKIESVLERIRPMLALHRGDVEFVSYDEETKTANVRLLGTCVSCPLSDLTLKGGIEEMVRQAIPEIDRVEAVM